MNEQSAARTPPCLSARSETALFLLILLAAAGLRLYALDASSLWSDEGNSWALIQRTFPEISRDAAADIHPPGYYWVLKAWSLGAGSSAAAMRLLSALLGVLLVAQTYAVGRALARFTARTNTVALLAALIAAFNPFQIYYSQEARMYILLALEAALLGWAAIQLLHAEPAPSPRLRWMSWALFVAAGIAGLWTHYSFPVMLLAVDLALLWHYLRQRNIEPVQTRRPFSQLITLNLLIVAAYLPWLGTALSSILNWPQGGEYIPASDALGQSLTVMFFGPLPLLPTPVWPWLALSAAFAASGALGLIRRPAGRLIILWALLPAGLLMALGLFNAAFLKILLVASPAWTLLLAAAVTHRRLSPRGRTLSQVGLILVTLLGAYATLPGYYSDPHARDNYAGIARYLAATADSAEDLLILNAPGQQDVWRYYDPGIEVLTLPRERPADPEATVAALAESTRGRSRVHAIYWATDESDPTGIVEGWLERNSYKGRESWQGNVRYATYHFAAAQSCTQLADAPLIEQQTTLLEVCGLASGTTIRAGDVLLLGLRWRAATPIAQSYAVSVQILNDRGRVIAQRDGLPGGGAAPTDTWIPDEVVNDNHGIHVPIGTPPGRHQIVVVLYEPVSGRRLVSDSSDMIPVGIIEVLPGDTTLPVELLPVQHIIDRPLGPLRLAGYSAHRLGFAHAPETRITPGDAVEFIVYWQAPAPLPEGWPPQIEATLALGSGSQTQPPGGATYPSVRWRAGELVRTTLVLPYDGLSALPTVTVAGETLQLRRLPVR